MEIEWEHMFRPDFDQSGTIAETWQEAHDAIAAYLWSREAI